PERIRALEPLFRLGRIHLPKVLPYVPLADDMPSEIDMIRVFVDEEYTAYPSCLHDDLLDAMARVVDPAADLEWPEAEKREERPAEKGWRERAVRRGSNDWMTM